jgi:hypothetical protein
MASTFNAHDAIPSGGPFLRGPSETVESGDNARTESRRLKRVDHLCFQQSAGDSTGPEVDVAKRLVGQDLSDDDIGDLGPASGFEHAGDLGKSPRFVRDEVQDTIRDDDVDETALAS